MTSKELVKIACMALDEKKGLDIVSINVESRTIICDYFIICSGKNTPQVKALCDNVVEKFDKIGLSPRAKEGFAEGRWIVLDYGDIVVHIFSDETRLFYHLERLWTFEDNMERFIPEIKEVALPVKKKRASKAASEKAVKTAKKTETVKKSAKTPITAVAKTNISGAFDTVKKPTAVNNTAKTVKKPRAVKKSSDTGTETVKKPRAVKIKTNIEVK